MSRRMQMYLLGVLLLVLVAVTLYNWRRSPEFATVLSADEKYHPLNIDNPSLRLDLLERIQKLEYSGTHRNIFSATPPAPPAPPPSAAKKDESAVPQAPPPLQVPFKFFGYATDPQSGKRRAFFTDGDDVWIVAEGELVQRRYRLLRIGNSAAEVEEVASGRRASLPLEQAPVPPG